LGLQPEQLLSSEQGPVRTPHIRYEPGLIKLASRREVVQIVQLFITAHVAGVQHMQVDQVSESEGTENRLVIAFNDRADRHPFKVCLQGLKFTDAIITFAGVMVTGTVFPGVVGDLMVIPNHDKRHFAVQRLKISIAPINTVTTSVILKPDQFQVVVRRECAIQ